RLVVHLSGSPWSSVVRDVIVHANCSRVDRACFVVVAIDDETDELSYVQHIACSLWWRTAERLGRDVDLDVVSARVRAVRGEAIDDDLDEAPDRMRITKTLIFFRVVV